MSNPLHPLPLGPGKRSQSVSLLFLVSFTLGWNHCKGRSVSALLSWEFLTESGDVYFKGPCLSWFYRPSGAHVHPRTGTGIESRHLPSSEAAMEWGEPRLPQRLLGGAGLSQPWPGPCLLWPTNTSLLSHACLPWSSSAPGAPEEDPVCRGIP